MTPNPRDRVLLVIGAGSVIVLPVAGVVAAHPGDALLPLPNSLAYFLVGAFAITRRPDLRAAQRMLVWGTTLALGYALGAAVSAVIVMHGVPSWALLAVLSLQAMNWLGSVAAFALFAVFPDGQYRGNFERGALVIMLGVLPLLLLAELLGRQTVAINELVWQDRLAAPNPLALASLGPVGQVAHALVEVGVPILLLFGAAVLVRRYRVVDPVQRRQIAWPLFAIALTGFSFIGLGALNALVPALPAALRYAAYLLVVLLIPVGLLVGMLRHGLLDIGVVIRRSMVYGVLWLVIGLAYVAVAAVLGVLVGRRVPLEFAVLGTILATVVVSPARRWLERVADRLVFGRRVSGYELISQLGARLQSTPAAEDVAHTVTQSVRAGLSAKWVRVQLSWPHEHPVAATGIGLNEQAEPVLRAPLVLGDERIGDITCGPKAEGRYTGADHGLLETLGRQAALSIRNSQLTTELSKKVAELAASRIRIVHAEEAGRRRLERDLHDGVQQELVALLARLGLAGNQLRRDPGLAADTLREGQTDARRALESLQEVVRGIHPSILTDRGLVVAVEERTSRLPIPVKVSSNGLGRERRFPSDIESGAYFFVSEALVNVLKHADAHTAWVSFRAVPDGIGVEVRDDGTGFAPVSSNGSGLRGLRDRIEALGGRLDVASAPGVGTTVSAFLPTMEQVDG